MAQSKNSLSNSEIAQRIKDILEAIKSPEHADDIIELRKIVRKNVPFFFRSYFAAYLLKQTLASSPKGGQRDQGRNRNSPKESQRDLPKRDQQKASVSKDLSSRENAQGGKGQRGRDQQSRDQSARDQAAGDDQKQRKEERKNERMAPLPEGVESATLFVSAGRKRHFYPRHLLDLFAGADIPRESIGEIRLFDNYTFVQILAEDAQKAVAGLDGAVFKGRKLTVNFARKKDDSADASSSPDFRQDDSYAASGEKAEESRYADSEDSGYGADAQDDDDAEGREADAAETYDDDLSDSPDEDSLGPMDEEPDTDDGLGDGDDPDGGQGDPVQ